MASRGIEKLTESAKPLLKHGETIQFVFPADTMNRELHRSFRMIPILGSILLLPLVLKDTFRNPWMALVLTDQRILVCHRPRMFPGNLPRRKVGGIIRELPRTTMLGYTDRSWIKTESLGQPIYISHRYVDGVIKADALARKAARNPGAS